MFIHRDIGHDRLGRDLNQYRDVTRATMTIKLYVTDPMTVNNLALTYPGAINHKDIPETRWIPALRKPVTFISEKWLKDPAMFASIVEHETVHQRQWARGDLTWSDDGDRIFWKGDEIEPGCVITEANIADHPHELEAYTAQLEVLNRASYETFTLKDLIGH